MKINKENTDQGKGEKTQEEGRESCPESCTQQSPRGCEMLVVDTHVICEIYCYGLKFGW